MNVARTKLCPLPEGEPIPEKTDHQRIVELPDRAVVLAKEKKDKLKAAKAQREADRAEGGDVARPQKKQRRRQEPRYVSDTETILSVTPIHHSLTSQEGVSTNENPAAPAPFVAADVNNSGPEFRVVDLDEDLNTIDLDDDNTFVDTEAGGTGGAGGEKAQASREGDVGNEDHATAADNLFGPNDDTLDDDGGEDDENVQNAPSDDEGIIS